MKTPLKVTLLPNGGTKIQYEGKEYLVPAGISVTKEKYDYFVDDVREYVTKNAFPFGSLHLFMVRDVAYKAIITEKDDSVFVIMMTAGSDHIGWAAFSRDKNTLVEHFAAVSPSFRRKGIYSGLIAYLKKRISPIILSDKSLSVSNALRWMKMGTYDSTYGRYRANPKPSKRDMRLAVLSLFTRAHTR